MRKYLVLAALRVLSVGMLGMVHPDEFFQSQEVMARHVLPEGALRNELFVPWEFQLPSPNRSVLFPFLVAGAPYKLLGMLGLQPTGLLLLLVPRLLLCVASFMMDAVIYAVVGKLSRDEHPKRRKQRQEQALLLFASSWPTLVFLCRPFSNTFETLVLALCFAVLFLVNPHRRVALGFLHVQTVLLGSLLAVGFFTRFTFPVFFFPLGVELVRQQDALLVEASRKKDVESSTSRRVLAAVNVGIQGLLAFLTWSLALIVMDTLYYHPELLESTLDGSFVQRFAANEVIAPLNNLMYNMQYENLELHGVHPRFTHLTVNLPMLFGPVFLVFLVKGLRAPEKSFFGTACVFFPLVMLSLAPHQEPRFMLPLLVPLHLFTALTGDGVTHFLTRNSLGILLWTIFNLALTLFFGVLHQGGIIPLLLTLSSMAAGTSNNAGLLLSLCRFEEGYSAGLVGSASLVFAKTYMPPRFLLAGMTTTSSFQVVDLAGNSVDNLPDLMKDTSTAFLVLPASVDVSEVIPATSSAALSWSLVGDCSPHLSTEDLDLSKPFKLELYQLTLATE